MKFGEFRTMMILVLCAGLVGLCVDIYQGFGPRRPGHGLRFQCASNLRQIGLGIIGYGNQYNVFPPGTIPNDALPPDRRLGWGVTILPYIDMVEQSNKLPAGYTGLPNDDPAFDPIRDPPGIAKCPQSLERRDPYLAIAGLGVDAPGLPTSHNRAGVFGEGRRVTLADIKDGTSTTMMVVESSTASGLWFGGGPGRVRGLDPSQKPYIGPARQFGGIHKGGVNVLFADGSVKFLSDSCDPRVFEALSTIAGGENLDVTTKD